MSATPGNGAAKPNGDGRGGEQAGFVDVHELERRQRQIEHEHERSREDREKIWSHVHGLGREVSELRSSVDRMSDEIRHHRSEAREDARALQQTIERSLQSQPSNGMRDDGDDIRARVERWTGAKRLAAWAIATLTAVAGSAAAVWRIVFGS